MADDMLTPREREVLALAMRGRTNKQIATALGISRNAVRYHIKEIHSKLQTGGDRESLAPRGRSGLSGILGLLSEASARAATVGMVGVLATTAVGAWVAWPDGGNPAGMPSRATVLAPDDDGRYPNGCPSRYTAWEGATIEDFGRIAGSTEAVIELNPGIPRGFIPAGTEVAVPYNPDGTCGLLEPTQHATSPEEDQQGMPDTGGGTPSATDAASSVAISTPTQPNVH